MWTWTLQISIERQMQGEADMSLEDVSVVPVPPVVYSPPSSEFVTLWIGEHSGADQWGKANSSLLRKGHTSDDELDEFQTPLSWLKESPNTRQSSMSARSPDLDPAGGSGVHARRYWLLKEVWDAY